MPPDELELKDVYIYSDDMNKAIKLNAKEMIVETKNINDKNTKNIEPIDLKQYQDLNVTIDLNDFETNNKLLNQIILMQMIENSKNKLNKNNINKHKKKNKTYKNWERKEFWRR